MKRLTCLVLSFLLLGHVACAAESTDNPNDGAEDDLTTGPSTSKLLGKVYAIKIDGTTLGARTKVATILNAMDLGKADPIPSRAGSMPRCPLSHPFVFIGERGKVLATAGLRCDEDQTTGAALAFVSFGTKTYQVEADLTTIFNRVRMPMDVGDVLYGVTSIALSNSERGTAPRASTSDAKAIRGILEALGQALTPAAPNEFVAPCTAPRTIAFYRGDQMAATLKSTCGTTRGSSTTGILLGPDQTNLGHVTLDQQKFTDVEATLSWSR